MRLYVIQRGSQVPNDCAPTGVQCLDPVSGEIDVQVLTLIERYATNLARWDLLLFFGRNPVAQDNASGIARQIGRRPQSIAKELDDLTYLGVLDARQNGNGLEYQLTRVSTLRRTVMRLAKLFDGPRSAHN